MDDFLQRTKVQSALETQRRAELVVPYLAKFDGHRFFPGTSPLQKTYKLDGVYATGKEHVLFEMKCVREDYPSIYAEFLQGRNNKGWINTEFDPVIREHKVHLIYAFKTYLIAYDMHALKAWYAKVSKEKYRVSTIFDPAFKREIHGHLIPLGDIAQFEIERYKKE